MSVCCRPFHLPQELTIAIVTAVYIHPNTNIGTILGQLQLMVTMQQEAYPDGVHIIAGDFNQANLMSVLPDFHQHVKCATRGENTRDVFTQTSSMFTEHPPSPTSEHSDHLSLFVFPAYTPLRK